MSSTHILALYIIGITLILINLLGMEVTFSSFHQDLLPEDERGKFLGILNITVTVSQIIGAISGGIVATLFEIIAIFGFAPNFFVISIIFFMRIKEILSSVEKNIRF